MITVVDAREFVDGASVDVRQLVGTVVGGLMISFAVGVWRFYDMVTSTLLSLYTRPMRALSELLELALSVPGQLLSASWRIAGDWFMGVGSALGPFAFPVAMIVVAISIWILELTLRQLGVFG